MRNTGNRRNKRPDNTEGTRETWSRIESETRITRDEKKDYRIE